MLNNKGFTIAEVLVSFGLISVILLSIIGSTVFYRDKMNQEEIKSQLIDYKNSITKLIYDDIINDRASRVETCIGYSNCLSIIGSDGSTHTLRIIEVATSTQEQKRGAYLSYDGINYFLPDSDLSEEDENGNIVRQCDFTNGIRYSFYNDLYTIKITFEHKGYNEKYDIMLTMIGGKNEYSYDYPRPVLRLSKSVVNLIYQGSDGENSYSYNGDGVITCESSDTSKVTCSVDRKHKKIIVSPIEITDTPVTITVNSNQISGYLEPPTAKFNVNVNKITPTISVSKNLVELTYGGSDGENTYSYNGDGVVTCSSSDISKVTCNVDASSKKITITPIFPSNSNVTITVHSSETSQYYANSVTFNVNVTKIVCNAPTNVSISTNGTVTWTASSICETAQHQISMDGINFTDASSGVDYNSSITESTGLRTVYVRALAPSLSYDNSSSATSSVTVYNVTLTQGTGISAVSGSGKYIDGASITIDATLTNSHYVWSNWTGTVTFTTKSTPVVVDKNYSLTANSIDLCTSVSTSTSCSYSDSCSCPSGTKSGTCTTRYYSQVSGYTDHECQDPSSSESSTSCYCPSWKYCYNFGSRDACSNRCNYECNVARGGPGDCKHSSTSPTGGSEDPIFCWCYY